MSAQSSACTMLLRQARARRRLIASSSSSYASGLRDARLGRAFTSTTHTFSSSQSSRQAFSDDVDVDVDVPGSSVINDAGTSTDLPPAPTQATPAEPAKHPHDHDRRRGPSAFLSRSLFVRTAEGWIPNIHAALALSRALGFPAWAAGALGKEGDGEMGRGEGEGEGKRARRRRRAAPGGAAGSVGEADGAKGRESLLRDLTFARGVEQRHYIGFGSLSLSTAEAVSTALKTQRNALEPLRYHVPYLRRPSERMVQEPLLGGTSRARIGLEDVADLVGLPSAHIAEALARERWGDKAGAVHGGGGFIAADSLGQDGQDGSSVGPAEGIDGDEAGQDGTGGEWREYKLERREQPPVLKGRKTRYKPSPSQ